MDIKITPKKLSGTVNIPSSKSMTHRMLICAALSDGISEISNITFSKDIYATINALESSGAKIKLNRKTITDVGSSKKKIKKSDICMS